MHFVHSLHKIFAMILDLTTENLESLGFANDEIKPMLSKKENYSLLNNLGSFYFDYIQNKIYTDIDKGRFLLRTAKYKRFPFSYPALIPEYFKFNLKSYLDEHQILLGTMFDKKEQTKEFIAKEVKEIKDIISSNQNYIDKYPNGNIEHKEIPIKIHKVYVSYLEKQTKEIDKPKIETKVNEVKNPKQLKDFFNSNIDSEVIEEIQNYFKDYNGKKMAYLIYLLDQEFKIINYSLNGKNDSRKHFAQALTKRNLKMQGINKYFETFYRKLASMENRKDNTYTDIEEKLTKTIK